MDNNSIIIDQFNKLSRQYQQNKVDKAFKFKAIALQNAAKKIKDIDIIIKSGSHSKKILDFSTKIADRIDEIIKYGYLLELEEESPEIQELTQITGIGIQKAKSLIEDGYNTIKKIRKGVKKGELKLTPHILVGLKWYEDLLERIPRSEVSELESILQQEIKEVDPRLILTVAGSYRRGVATCGDIDCLLTLPPNVKSHNQLKNLVKRLHEINFLVDDITIKGDKKYMGVCQLLPCESKGRRIDLRFVDYENYFAAIIYFTGSKNFNIKIRKEALKKGYSLNEYGFTNKKTGEQVLVHSEEELFDIIGIEYVKPEDRDI